MKNRHQSSRPRRRERRAAGPAGSLSRASAPGSSALVLGDRGVQNDRRDPRAAGPLSPDEALASFELEPGYRIELAAAEPLIRDPVAMAFDDRGRMYVVENRGYPGPLEGAEARSAAEGVVALLEDTNRDGRFDKRTDFARQLTFPNGIMAWDGGVFVSCAPDLLYLKDTNDDGVADERRVVLTGFDASKTSQLRFSHPTLGIDNWIYLTSGLAGGRVTAPDHPERAPVALGTNDSRFNPLTLAFEVTGGQGQYGLTFDDYGRRFTCSNRRPVMHVVLEAGDLKRNPHLAFSQTVEDVSAAGAQAAVWPISGDTTTASFIPSLMSAPHAGTFTAASGVHIHRGDALPAADRGSIFICESAQNLVQRQVLASNGVTFTSRPARTGRDFLASRDTWFRPVFAANGPDGALYIVDMYRRIIDHPQYVPEQSRALLDFEAGKERGRIYRIVAGDWKRDRRPIDLGRMTARGTGPHARAPECVVARNCAAAARRAPRSRGRPAPPQRRAGQPQRRGACPCAVDARRPRRARTRRHRPRPAGSSTPAFARTRCGWRGCASGPLKISCCACCAWPMTTTIVSACASRSPSATPPIRGPSAHSPPWRGVMERSRGCAPRS